MDTIIRECIIAASAYIAGLITGLFIHNIFKKKDFKNNDIVLIAVTLIWALSRIVSVINLEYQSSPLIDGLMGMIVGFFYKGTKLPFNIGGNNEKTKNK